MSEREDSGWFLRDSHLNEPQQQSIAALVAFSRGMSRADVIVRKNGEDHGFEVDWLKHIKRVDGTTAEARAGHALEEYQTLTRMLDHYAIPKERNGSPLGLWGRVHALALQGLPPPALQGSDGAGCEMAQTPN
jgi:hypothetical protein